jgi:hypothetical protein
MTAYNVVRFRVKPGREKDFEQYHRDLGVNLTGTKELSLIKTGDRTYCFIGKWDNMASIVAARPQMIPILDGVRDMLEDLGGGLGVTDPVSGDVVVDMPAHQ